MGLSYSIVSYISKLVLPSIEGTPVDSKCNGSMLANLPHDIIRRIIPFEKHSFGHLRLISPTWNRMVLEHFNNREGRIPLVGIILARHPRGIKASVRIDPTTESRFIQQFPDWERYYRSSTLLYTRILEWKHHDKMPKLNRRCSPLLGNKISVVEEFKVSANDCDGSRRIFIFCQWLDSLASERKIRHTLRYLRRFFLECSELRFFAMKYLPVADMRAICQTLRGIPANTFCVRMMICDVEKRDFMLGILKHVNTKRLMMRAGFCTRTNLGEFLLEISKVLLMISIQQFGLEYRLFGIPRYFWMEISRQMMGNGLDHFKISRYANPRKGLIERRREEDSRPIAIVNVRLNESF